MLVQNPKMLEDFDLSLRCQVLVAEENNPSLINECGKLIQLLVIQLTQLYVRQLSTLLSDQHMASNHKISGGFLGLPMLSVR